jgi:DNA-binding transcriptional regulator YiaG
MSEEWRDIEGEPGYQVSSEGRVRSFYKRGGAGHWFIASTPQRILRPSPNKAGYLGVNLRNGYARIAPLAMRAFIGPCPGGMEVCHNDSNPRNNHVSNLRYDTHKNNMAEAPKVGPDPLSPSQVQNIRSLRSGGMSCPDIAKLYHLSRSHIAGICAGRIYQAYPGPITQAAAKLTPADVTAMREAYKGGNVTMLELARKYNISESMVSRTINGKRY